MPGSPHLRSSDEATHVVGAAPALASALEVAGFRRGWVHGQEHPNGFVRELWWTHGDALEFGALAILPEGPVLAFDTLCRDGTVVTTSTPRPPLQAWRLENCWEKTVVDRPFEQLLAHHRSRVAAHDGPAAPHLDRALALGIEVRVEELILAADLPSARMWAGVAIALTMVGIAAVAAALGLDVRAAVGAGAVGGLVIVGAWLGRSGPLRRSADEIVALGVLRIEAESRRSGRAVAR